MFLLFLVGLPPAWLQKAAPTAAAASEPAPYTFHVTTRDVIVDIIAVDGHDHPILDLHPADLQVFDQPTGHNEGKLPERIVSLSLVDPSGQQGSATEPTAAGFQIAPTCLDQATPHYSLAYHPGPQAWTSGAHQVTVKPLRRGVHLYYRHSYYVGATAPPPGKKPLPTAEIDAELRDDACDHPSVPLSVGLRARSIETGDPAILRFSVSVDADSLAFISLSDNGRRVQLDYAVCNFDASGMPLNYFTVALDQVLNSVDYTRAVAHGFPHLLQFPAPQHLAMTRFIVRDRSTGNVGSAEIVVGAVEPPPPNSSLLEFANIDLEAARSANLLQTTVGTPAPNIYAGKPPQGPMGSFGSVVLTAHSFCGDVFELQSMRPELPDFRDLDPVGAVYTRSLDVPNQIFSGTKGIPGVTPRTVDFGIDYHASFWVTNPGRYEFMMVSDDGARLQIDDKQIIDLDGLHTARTRVGTITLDVGPHTMHVPYYQGAPSAVALLLWVNPPNGQWQILNLGDFLPPSTPRPSATEQASAMHLPLRVASAPPLPPSAPLNAPHPVAAGSAAAIPPISPGQPIAPAARTYLTAALNLLEQHAFDPSKIDWKALRAQAFRDAAGAQTPAGTYPAINAACLQLGRTRQCSAFDPSYSAPPEILAMVQDQATAAQAGSGEDANDSSPSPFPGRSQPDGKLLPGVGGDKFAYVAVSTCSGGEAHLDLCAAQLRLLLVKMASANPAGWIVDLRGNSGGELWRPLVALGPLLDGGTVGYLKVPQGGEPWIYAANAISTQISEMGIVGDETYSRVLWSMPGPHFDVPPRPVAVLIDHGTAGAGESLAIAFAGRKDERSFGTPTQGGSDPGNGGVWPLSDGATLKMPKGIAEDRHGHTYPNGVRPDVLISMEDLASSDRDSVLQAAEAWIETVH
jgi:carboxyl-terminal processing protease